MSPAAGSVTEVHKFGGASLADPKSIAHAVAIARALPGRPVIVVSAIAGVTDGLLAAIREAAAGDAAAASAHAKVLADKYRRAVRALLRTRRATVDRAVRDSFAELDRILSSLVPLRHVTPRISDYLLARGERLSALLFAAALEEAGRPARFVDALEIVATDGPFGGAAPDLRTTARNARRILRPLVRKKLVPVVPGFLGAGPEGQVATLGRGGADLTATLLGAALGVREISLWKDVAGILSADPRIVPEARVIPRLHLREAGELAYYGAKVLHPRALIPLGDRNITVRVRPFAAPTEPGTEISRRAGPPGYPVKAVSCVADHALVTVTGNGMLGVPGIAARTFEAVHRTGLSISLITQASSEHSISFALPGGGVSAARKSLLEEFRREIDRGEIDDVLVKAGVSIIAIVGDGVGQTPGVAARVFSALAEAEINIVAMAQGSSDLNLSVVVDAADAKRAQRVVHAGFQLDKLGGGGVDRRRGSDVVFLGFGQVGRALAPMIARRNGGAVVRVVAIIDRSGYVFQPRGFTEREVAALDAAKRRGVPLARATGGRTGSARDAIDALGAHALARPILVDLTAGETGDVLRAALDRGFDLVLANKRPLTGPQAEYDALHRAAAERGRRVRFEATVGAGLPIIDTFDKLVESGDRVLRVEGCPSGTLGFLFGQLGLGRPFSRALEDAIARGYTEPDPRDDLSGTDVARKALIVGRMLGFTGELAEVAAESLVPVGGERLPLRDFLARLETWDAGWARRIQAARERGGALRYRVVATRRKIAVGLKVVDLMSPTGSLQGTDNQFSFSTLRYKESPLVITGPGAGPAVTAGGILNDVLQLARA